MADQMLVPPAFLASLKTWVWPTAHLPGAWFAWSEALQTVAAGALVLQLVGLCKARKTGHALPQSALGLALLAQTAAMLLAGLGAQGTWGAYWSWDPLECWRLLAWLALLATSWGARGLGWGRRRAIWATAVTLVILLISWWGAPPLLRWLGLSSLYLAGW